MKIYTKGDETSLVHLNLLLVLSSSEAQKSKNSHVFAESQDTITSLLRQEIRYSFRNPAQ
jgi:hypothetical protein